MTKTFCDHCGKEIRTPGTLYVKRLGMDAPAATDIDLCDDCIDAVITFARRQAAAAETGFDEGTALTPVNRPELPFESKDEDLPAEHKKAVTKPSNASKRKACPDYGKFAALAMQGWTCEQIGVEFGVSVKTVYRYWNQALDLGYTLPDRRRGRKKAATHETAV